MSDLILMIRIHNIYFCRVPHGALLVQYKHAIARPLAVCQLSKDVAGGSTLKVFRGKSCRDASQSVVNRFPN